MIAEMTLETAGSDGGADVSSAESASCKRRSLRPVLDLTEANRLRDDMIRFATEGDILLDASAVERMSTPCVQVLLSAGRTMASGRKIFKISNPSDAFGSAIAELGLQAEFDKWME